MIATIRPDFNWPVKQRTLLIGCILILAALCSLFGLYKIFERVTLMAEQPGKMHRLAISGAIENNLWLFATLGFTGFVVLVIVAFFALYRLWHGPKNLFEAVFDAAHEAVAITDGQGRIIYYNRQLLRNWGAPGRNSRLYEHLPFMFTADIRDEIERHLEQHAVWSGKLLYPRDEEMIGGVAEVTITRTDRDYRAVTMRDISAQEHYMALADQRLAAIEAAGEGIGITDPQGRVVYMNMALCTMLGISRADADTRFYDSDWRNLFAHEGAPRLMPRSCPSWYGTATGAAR